MYVDLIYWGRSNSHGNHRFELIDTDFSRRFDCFSNAPYVHIMKMMRIYKGTGMSVSPNIARYYVKIIKQYADCGVKVPSIRTRMANMISDHKSAIINDMSEDNYQLVAHYPCIERQIRQLTFAKFPTPII
jgi:hypothetical protein